MSDTPHDPGEDRLLPGEKTSIDSHDARDVRHWIAVYHELYSFKEKLLQEVEEQLKCVTPPGAFELENDLKLLGAEGSRLRRRLEFWEQYLREIGARPQAG
ncbi:MAG TPA: hypothetical protein VJS19_06825 [Candidatus Dormibacteraeota bacterium]|nr:hypothetical protein [Candidatus Dormibacteraeota bacterium]